MTTVEGAILRMHIAAGAVALLAGLGALVATKGSRRHVRSGQVYAGSMAVVVVTVFALTFLDATLFRRILTLIAVFAGYFVFSGYRLVTRKARANDPEAIDWVAVALLSVVGLALVGWGVRLALGGDQFGVVMVAFGGIGTAVGAADWRRFRGSGPNRTWMAGHLGNMIGAYIATVTAVSATNLTAVPPVVAWLWPTVLGVPLIWYWQAKYDGVGPFDRLVSD